MNVATAPVCSEVIRRFERGRPLAPMTTFRIGGPSTIFLSCRSIQDVQQAVWFCRQEGMQRWIKECAYLLAFKGPLDIRMIVIKGEIIIGANFFHNNAGS